ncbi:MAG: MerR family transcriptional regulator [Lachnospiraceae bacterium]|nr:MerR family transcriptional regulator [Lachnospiraceae bacterium]
MEYMTLREVCDSAGVSRRAIQGYENAGLVFASGKNERGYLLYDLHSLDRIKRIKLYQQFGFTVKEIGDIIDAPNSVLKAVLENQLIRLKEEKRQIELLIDKAGELITKYS